MFTYILGRNFDSIVLDLGCYIHTSWCHVAQCVTGDSLLTVRIQSGQNGLIALYTSTMASATRHHKHVPEIGVGNRKNVEPQI